MPITTNRVKVYGNRPAIVSDFMDIYDNKDISKEDKVKLLTEQYIKDTGLTKEEYEFIIEFLLSLNKKILQLIYELDRYALESVKDTLIKLIKGGIDVIGDTLGVKSAISHLLRDLYRRQGITSISKNNAFMTPLRRFIIALAIMELIDRGEEEAYSIIVEANKENAIDSISIALAMDYILKEKKKRGNNLQVVKDMLGNSLTIGAIPYIHNITDKIVTYLSMDDSISSTDITDIIASLNDITGDNSYLPYIEDEKIVDSVRDDLLKRPPIVDYEAKGDELTDTELIAVLGRGSLEYINPKANDICGL